MLGATCAHVGLSISSETPGRDAAGIRCGVVTVLLSAFGRQRDRPP